MARAADITLTNADELRFDLDDPGYGFDLGPLDGIGSQDFGDLGISFGDNAEPLSVEVGRDADMSRMSVDSNLRGDREASIARSRMSEDPFSNEAPLDFGPDAGGMDIDFGLDFGGGDFGVERPKSSRACEFDFQYNFLCLITYQLHHSQNHLPRLLPQLMVYYPMTQRNLARDHRRNKSSIRSLNSKMDQVFEPDKME